MNTHTQVKLVGVNGQVSLGKAFAGKMVLIDQVSTGTWVIKTGAFIPDTEQWLHEKEHATKLNKALAWAEKNKPHDNFEQFTKSFKDE